MTSETPDPTTLLQQALSALATGSQLPESWTLAAKALLPAASLPDPSHEARELGTTRVFKKEHPAVPPGVSAGPSLCPERVPGGETGPPEVVFCHPSWTRPCPTKGSSSSARSAPY